MRVERAGGRKRTEWKVWITKEEYDSLKDSALEDRKYLVTRLGGECSLRAFEMIQIKPKHISDYSGNNKYSYLKVPKGKDTKRGKGKPRNVFLPPSLEGELLRYANRNGIDNDDQFFDCTQRTIRREVKRLAEKMAEDTGNKDWKKFSVHDLRRFFAHYNLTEKRRNPEVVMELGGWEGYDSIKPYLGKPSEGNIISEMKDVYD